MLIVTLKPASRAAVSQLLLLGRLLYRLNLPNEFIAIICSDTSDSIPLNRGSIFRRPIPENVGEYVGESFEFKSLNIENKTNNFPVRYKPCHHGFFPTRPRASIDPAGSARRVH
jgi:hypothetical protein